MEPCTKREDALPTLDIKAEPARKAVDDAADTIVERLLPKQDSWKHIRSMRLSGNSYGANAISRISNAVSAAVGINTLDLSDCFLGRTKEEIGPSIFNMLQPLKASGVVELNLSNNPLGFTGARIIAPFMDKLPRLRRLFLANCGLGATGTREILDYLVEAKELEVLSLGRNRLDAEGGLSLAQSIKLMPTLKVLVLFENSIRKHAMCAIIDGLQQLKKLQEIDLSDNFVSGEGVDKLCKLLGSQQHAIRSLNLSDSISKDSLPAIIEAISIHRKVQRLGLNYVELRDSRLAMKLLDCLQKCPLKCLQIQGTDMSKHMRQEYETRLASKLGKLNFEDYSGPLQEQVTPLGSMSTGDVQ